MKRFILENKCSELFAYRKFIKKIVPTNAQDPLNNAGIIFYPVLQKCKMNNPLFDRRHLKEYILFGTLAAIGYVVPLLIFLTKNRYESLYLLFMGLMIFMVPIFFYGYKLLYTRYDEKRAVSMLLAGVMTTFTGIAIAAIASFILVWIYYPGLFGNVPVEKVLPGTASQSQQHPQSYLLMMVLITATIGNFLTGTFISVVVSYAGKRDQTRDKPAEIGPQKKETVNSI